MLVVYVLTDVFMNSYDLPFSRSFRSFLLFCFVFCSAYNKIIITGAIS